MEHSIKIRIELGLTVSAKLSPVSKPDGHKATIRALLEILTMDEVHAGVAIEGKSGNVTAYVKPTQFDIGFDRKIPNIHHIEIIGMLRVEESP
ncbi:hypothetical protein [Singulisphaera acidiphila]|uniref:Uncharacterized protein n=1 Tax=Singulisphaera acidiphila (strain ATCC BAA-1392 / DSM 18658 / VKM B-2454 / MOB10) TaxID=886293 RepID=L0DI31_SINAD|nr:hypothetical protein [Singulisphaera acidiphila]AGA28510.1 hypothetical protein Sinac_4312 [Singulisphaera acidiphila DSM 18658]